MPAVDATDLERIFREESGRVVATLVRLFGDIDIAEEMVQEAFLVASERWPETGLPPTPAAGSPPPPATAPSTACAVRHPAMTATPKPRCSTRAPSRPSRWAT